MEKNTKILLGVAAVGVVAYLVFKNKKPNPNINTENTGTLSSIAMSKDERDCSIEYAMSAHPKDMPSEATQARREADFIKRCLELKSRLSRGT